MSQQFFEAIRGGDRGTVESLLSSDATLLAAKDDKGLGAYTAAKYSGRNEIAALLLEKGVELDVFAACMAGAERSRRGVDWPSAGACQALTAMTDGRRYTWRASSPSLRSWKC